MVIIYWLCELKNCYLYFYLIIICSSSEQSAMLVSLLESN